MTSSTDSMPATPPPAPTARTRQRTGGHIAAIVIGGLALLPSLGVLASGTALAIGEAVATDDDGYFAFTIDRLETDGVALATQDIWEDDVDEDGPWVFDMLDVDLRLRVDGAGPTDDVFVGIARTEDLADYLAGAPYSEVTDIDDDHVATYEQIGGTETGAANLGSPLDQDFWAASASGTGEQELTWNARGGRWSVVVMNADGSRDVSADVEVGARSDAVTPIAVTLIVLGAIGTLVSVGLIVFGARGRRSPGSTGGIAPTDRPLPPPAPESVTHPIEDTRTATPVG